MQLDYGRLDIARFAACLSVIGIHSFSDASMPVVNQISFWAMPFFFLVSGFLSAPRMVDAGWIRARLLHIVRIAVPWLVLGRLIRFAQDGIHYSVKQLAGDLVIGASWGHLWYLPALFMVTLGGWLALRFHLQKVALALAGLAAVAFLVVMPMLSDRWDDYLYRTPLFWFALFLLGANWAVVKLKLWWAAFPGLALVIWSGWVPPEYELTVLLPGATLVALAVARWALVPTPRTVLWKRLGETSLGIYLMHQFVIAALEWAVPGLIDWGPLLWLTTVVISLGSVLILLRLPVLRRLVS